MLILVIRVKVSEPAASKRAQRHTRLPDDAWFEKFDNFGPVEFLPTFYFVLLVLLCSAKGGSPGFFENALQFKSVKFATCHCRSGELTIPIERFDIIIA